jgi:uncharacterized membrane protein YozB (DUF420 family)
MKILGLILIIIGISCAAFVVTGLFAWTTPVPEDSTPASLANIINWRMISFSGLGFLFFASGLFLVFRGRKKQNKPAHDNS